jgi:hypothetical protein
MVSPSASVHGTDQDRSLGNQRVVSALHAACWRGLPACKALTSKRQGIVNGLGQCHARYRLGAALTKAVSCTTPVLFQ